ncbi:MAG: homoserine O-acetyltransferase [Bacteroidales bacterium]|nr:homoserine O-acetyltransferase [Bacteroides sp.]MCM1198499.1 homoserine O-acetyltransferase [Clostridium sp.]MCM1502170.1 homoserine O-acetyltransferase [Bacteroidales bacterium]
MFRFSTKDIVDNFFDRQIMIRCEYTLEEPFEFEAGGQARQMKIVYHVSESATCESRKVIWICHALTANSDPSEWWPELVGPGRLFDTEKYLVVCVNMLGSAYGSAGPSSISPHTGKPYLLDFPKITVRDIVRANIEVRKHLGIDSIDLMVGGSIGGFQALEWSIMEPDIVKRTVMIACNARVTPWMTAYNESQRMALEADPTFRACENPGGGKAGLQCARSIALISYRSYEGYNSTQAEDSMDTLLADRAASYQRYQGRKLSDRFDAYSYCYLTWSVDSHNVGRGRGGVAAALGRIASDCTVVGIDSDALFPVNEQKDLAGGIRGAHFHMITSRFGHDGFLLENSQLTEIISPIINELEK